MEFLNSAFVEFKTIQNSKIETPLRVDFSIALQWVPKIS